MGKRLVGVMTTAMLVLALLLFPNVTAYCPKPPSDCGSLVEMEDISLEDSTTLVGAYKEEAEKTIEGAQAQDDGILGLGGSQSSEAMSHDDGPTDDAYQVGDSGGALIVIEDMGSASEITVTFDGDSSGIAWDAGSSITITAQQVADGTTHFALPYTVTSADGSVHLSFEVEDDLGHHASGSLDVGEDGSEDIIFLLLLALLIGAIVFFAIRVAGNP